MENKLNSLLEKIQQQQPDFSFDRNKIEEEIESKSTIFSHIGIKLLSVIGGILGSVFFLGFLASIVFDSPRGCIIFGSLFIIGSVVIHKISHSILLDTGIICLYLAGGLLLGYGLNSEHVGDNGLAFIALIISLIVLFLSQGFMLAFLSLLIANSALLSFVFINDAYNLLHLYMLYVIVVFSLLTYSEAWIVSQKLKISRLYNPVRSGFLITFIFTLLVFSENYKKTPLNAGEYLINYTAANWNINIGAESYFFEEGKADKFDSAEYGALKIDNEGHSLLIGLYDKNFRWIRP